MNIEKQQNIPPVLEFAKLNDIKIALGTSAYYSMLSDVENKSGKKPTLKEIKKYLMTNDIFLKMVLKNEKLGLRFEKEGESFELKKSEDKNKKREINELMKLPKKQYR